MHCGERSTKCLAASDICISADDSKHWRSGKNFPLEVSFGRTENWQSRVCIYIGCSSIALDKETTLFRVSHSPQAYRICQSSMHPTFTGATNPSQYVLDTASLLLCILGCSTMTTVQKPFPVQQHQTYHYGRSNHTAGSRGRCSTTPAMGYRKKRSCGPDRANDGNDSLRSTRCSDPPS